MEPTSNPNFVEPRYIIEIAPDFDGREHDVEFSSDYSEPWFDAREGKDEMGGY
jgi:hypothetical protein